MIIDLVGQDDNEKQVIIESYHLFKSSVFGSLLSFNKEPTNFSISDYVYEQWRSQASSLLWLASP